MSKIHGPRMSRERTREVLDKLGISVQRSDGHGIVIHRAGAGGIEQWRLHTGGGIAGNSDRVWLARVAYTNTIQGEPRGPYWNKTQLEKALRAWRRGG